MPLVGTNLPKVQQPVRAVEEWMLVCQCSADFQQETASQPEIDWSQAARVYPKLEEMSSFIAQQDNLLLKPHSPPLLIQSNFRENIEAYTIVCQHIEAINPPPLRMIIPGTAGTSKSYLINCLRLLLQDKVRVSTPSGVAVFNVDGHTLLSSEPAHQRSL